MAEFLDESAGKTSFRKILAAVYEYAGVKMPEWFNTLLPENQLEESLADNEVIVKRAFA
jgi:hypothetical protein